MKKSLRIRLKTMKIEEMLENRNMLKTRIEQLQKEYQGALFGFGDPLTLKRGKEMLLEIKEILEEVKRLPSLNQNTKEGRESTRLRTDLMLALMKIKRHLESLIKIHDYSSPDHSEEDTNTESLIKTDQCANKMSQNVAEQENTLPEASQVNKPITYPHYRLKRKFTESQLPSICEKIEDGAENVDGNTTKRINTSHIKEQNLDPLPQSNKNTYKVGAHNHQETTCKTSQKFQNLTSVQDICIVNSENYNKLNLVETPNNYYVLNVVHKEDSPTYIRASIINTQSDKANTLDHKTQNSKEILSEDNIIYDTFNNNNFTAMDKLFTNKSLISQFEQNSSPNMYNDFKRDKIKNEEATFCCSKLIRNSDKEQQINIQHSGTNSTSFGNNPYFQNEVVNSVSSYSKASRTECESREENKKRMTLKNEGLQISLTVHNRPDTNRNHQDMSLLPHCTSNQMNVKNNSTKNTNTQKRRDSTTNIKTQKRKTQCRTSKNKSSPYLEENSNNSQQNQLATLLSCANKNPMLLEGLLNQIFSHNFVRNEICNRSDISTKIQTSDLEFSKDDKNTDHLIKTNRNAHKPQIPLLKYVQTHVLAEYTPQTLLSRRFWEDKNHPYPEEWADDFLI